MVEHKEKLWMTSISKSFPGIKALDDVSLIGHASEVIGLGGGRIEVLYQGPA